MMTSNSTAVMHTHLPLPNRRQGKVRDIYDTELPGSPSGGSGGLLIVASDRISAFDVVMSNGVPGKGIVLTQISHFWFHKFSKLISHHLVSTDSADIPGLNDQQRRELAGRVMVCRKTRVVPIECIVRGYLTGSGWKDYQKTGAVCGIALPRGMVNGSIIETPIFTPSTKAESGHDENISFEEGAATVGAELMTKLRDLSIRIYSEARTYAAAHGIIIADTKFEFGLPEGSNDPILIDEVLTPDSSRFWPADRYKPGQEQPSLDKQYVRNYLEELVKAGKWDKTPPGPVLPEDVVNNTLSLYKQAYRSLTGEEVSGV